MGILPEIFNVGGDDDLVWDGVDPDADEVVMAHDVSSEPRDSKGRWRKFYRGTTPGDTRRIDEPFEAAKGKTFVARRKSSAQMYGSSIDRIRAKQEAKILYQEDTDFWKLLGRKRPPNSHLASVKGGMIENVNRIIRRAMVAGYHAVSFTSDSDVGTVILKRSMFKKKTLK